MMIIGNPIYDRAEEASFFAEFFASFIGNGIYPNPSTNMQVISKNGMNLTIQPGKCFINGYFGLVEEGGETVTIETADTNYSRIDRIVARWDLELRKIMPYILKGIPASNPIAPEITRNSNIYEIVLADVTVKANTTVVTQANITDKRLDTNLCGVVAGVIQQLDTTTLFNQYQAWLEERKQESTNDYQIWFEEFTEPSEEQFTEWFNGIKERLGEDVATNLQVQIDELKPLIEEMKIEMLKLENPVGHIRMETTNINPANYLGFGTWELWGSGKVPVGIDINDTDFDAVEKTGGVKAVTLTTAQIPSHTHTFTGTGHTHTLNNHTHTIPALSGSAASNGAHTHTVKMGRTDLEASGYGLSSNGGFVNRVLIDYSSKTTATSSNGAHTHTVSTKSSTTGGNSNNTSNATAGGTNSNTGGGESHQNLQPYITCYMWKRTA